jgi:hypothetical protein
MSAGQSPETQCHIRWPEPCRVQKENRMTTDVGELVVRRAREVEAPT